MRRRMFIPAAGGGPILVSETTHIDLTGASLQAFSTANPKHFVTDPGTETISNSGNFNVTVPDTPVQIDVSLSFFSANWTRAIENIDGNAHTIVSQIAKVVSVFLPDAALIHAFSPVRNDSDARSSFDGGLNYGGTSGILGIVQPTPVGTSTFDISYVDAPTLALFPPGSVSMGWSHSATRSTSGSPDVFTRPVDPATLSIDVTVWYYA